jgi:RHS repeat-associated protein
MLMIRVAIQIVAVLVVLSPAVLGAQFSIVPPSAPAGARVLVVGNSLANADATFAGTNVPARIIARSASVLEVVVPPDAESGPVAVTNGTSPMGTAEFSVTAPAEYVRIATLAGQGLQTPASAAVILPDGRLVIADRGNHQIRLLSPDGQLLLTIGTGKPGYRDGAGPMAQFSQPSSVVFDAARNVVYVGDTGNHVIRRITLGGDVATVAGSGKPADRDGTGTSAGFKQPSGVAVDDDGNVYVADTGNHKIRRISVAGAVSTLAGTGAPGYRDGAAIQTMFKSPEAVAAWNGAVYVADTQNHVVRMIVNGVTSTLAGTAHPGLVDGPAANAEFHAPAGIAVRADGTIVIADTRNHRMRAIHDGAVRTLAGTGTPGYADGAPGTATFHEPAGVTVEGALFLADAKNNALRVVYAGVIGSAFHPATVKPDGGELVRIFGSGFVPGATEVRVDGAIVPVTYLSSTDLSILTPAHPIATVDITITTPGGTATISGFRYAPAFVAISIVPDGATFDVGQSGQFTAYGMASDGSLTDLTTRVSWMSTSPEVASIDAAGAVTALSPGTSTISASFETLTASVQVTVLTPEPLPPDPTTVAPELPTTKIPGFKDSTKFLYTGDAPIQTGVSESTIDEIRAGVTRGVVRARDGRPLGGVKVHVLNHSEFGETLSRADGMYDLVINGGKTYVIAFEKSGYLTAHRKVYVPWQDYAHTDDVVLVRLDSAATIITAGADQAQVARANTVTDSDGTRRATLLVPANTTATMTAPDGSVTQLDRLTVRATEYTVGTTGLAAMPAELPPQTGYTYCVELSADEAIEAGATKVTFSKPLAFYLENFIDLPDGIIVPSGYYDRALSAWIPSDNGRIVRIVAINAGLADLDVNGDGNADAVEALAAFGIDSAEREALAGLYAAGASLWRVPIPHFTPWDHNFPWGPPEDAESPEDGPEWDESVDDAAQCVGSAVRCENQTLGEEIPIAGTPFSLTYNSGRVAGRKAEKKLRIPVTGDTVPASLKSVTVKIDVAGKTTERTFEPTPSQQMDFEWDGSDAYGRATTAGAQAQVRVAYHYEASYYDTPQDVDRAFGRVPRGTTLATRTARAAVVLPSTWTVPIAGAPSAEQVGLGGWTFSPHHLYDFSRRTLLFGNGEQRSYDPRNVQSSQVLTVGGRANGSGDGSGIATRERLDAPYQVAVGPDGTIYMDEREEVRKITPDGRLVRIAGTGVAGYSGDGGPATQAQIDSRGVIVLGPDGSLYIPDEDNWRVRRIKDGIITTVAGNGQEPTAFPPENVPATSVALWPLDVAVASDGTLYIADGLARIYRVTPDGNLQRYAGGGESLADGVNASEARLKELEGLAVGPDGSIYYGDNLTGQGAVVRRITPDGVVRTAAGGGAHCTSLQFPFDGPAESACFEKIWFLSVGNDGTVYIPDNAGARVRTLAPDGIVRTVLGNGKFATRTTITNGGIATGSTVNQPWGATPGPDGGLYVSDVPFGLVRRVAPANPRFSASDTVLASADGTMLYVFDGSRHMKTVNALTNATLYTFGYASGQLASVTDIDGNVTTIERDADGQPTAIVAPGGQRTMLEIGDDGYLARIENPAGEAYNFQYGSGGLLAEMRTPRDRTYTFTHDDEGRLETDQGPTGSGLHIIRSGSNDDWTVTTSSTLGLTTTRSRTRSATGQQSTQSTRPGSITSTANTAIDGTITRIRPDGITVTATLQPDPRFGLQVPVVSSTLQYPSGRKIDVATTRTATLSNPNDVFSLATLVSTVKIDNRTITRTYDAAARTLTTRTPAGRTSKVFMDAAGRITRIEAPGLEPVQITYSDGQPATVRRGTRAYSMTYDEQRRIEQIAGPAPFSMAFDYDAAGRAASQTQDGAATALVFDENGNVTTITPPGRPSHRLTFTDADDLESHVTGGDDPATTQYLYNADRQLRQVIRPDGSSITFEYDGNGRPESVSSTDGSMSIEWDQAGRLKSIGSPSADVTFTYDGNILTALNYGGAAPGSVTYGYDTGLRPVIETVAGTSISFGYDADDLLTQAGAMTLTRNSASGVVTNTTIGTLKDTFTRNTYGDVTAYSAQFGTTPLFSQTYTRDAAGRIGSVTESIQGTTVTRTYGYDNRGRLTTVTLNGTNAAAYAYDGNGNRLTRSAGSVAVTGVYDDADRLTSYDGATYSYTQNGVLKSKTDGSGTTTYQYDAFGNLGNVTLPGGTTVDYVSDGFGRRVARKFNGVYTNRWLYRRDLQIVAELDAAGAVISRFVYGSRVNVPDYMIRGGKTYRILSDHLGSPRLVVDTANGTVVHRMDYDEFGNVTTNTMPGFIPFGYAGGIYDSSTGLTRFGARDYDARVGRWTAPDPMLFAGGANLYGYAHGDPINFLDMNGREPVTVAILTSIAIRAGVGAAAGAVGDLLAQGFSNLEAGNGFFDCLDWKEVGVAALAGAGVGVLGPASLPSAATAGGGFNLLQWAATTDDPNAVDAAAAVTIGAFAGAAGKLAEEQLLALQPRPALRYHEGMYFRLPDDRALTPGQSFANGAMEGIVSNYGERGKCGCQ